MPWGWECKERLVKQVPLKPTIRVHPISKEFDSPGPNYYDPPKICGGPGFSKIRRAPAYSFGYVLRTRYPKSVSPNAPMFNIRGISEKGGGYKIPGGIITPYIEPLSDKMRVPGPGAYTPKSRLRSKSVPAYSMRPAAKPPYQPFDSWTPPPNMYCPPIPKPRAPAYTFGDVNRDTKTSIIPAPGEHNPNYNFVHKTKPAFSFGPPARVIKQLETPAPNIYCEKKFMLNKPSAPAPSFGIRHSPFLGKSPVNLKPSDLELRLSKM